jgi:hypothetical protein
LQQVRELLVEQGLGAFLGQGFLLDGPEAREEFFRVGEGEFALFL